MPSRSPAAAFRPAAALLAAALPAIGGGCASLWRPTPASPFGAATLPPPTAALQSLGPAESANVCAAAAAELARAGRTRSAIEQYERVRGFQPERRGVAARLAVLYGQEGEAERASAEFRRALEEEPDNADLWTDCGYFRYEQGDLAGAEEALRRALALQPRLERAAVNLGLVLGAAGRYDEARLAFARALPPAAVEANLAVLLARAGETDAARAACRQALALDGALETPRRLLAQLERTPRAAGPHPASAPPLAALPPLGPADAAVDGAGGGL